MSNGSGAATGVGGTDNGSSGSGSSSAGMTGGGYGGYGGYDPGVCGDGVYSVYEQCDDGNTVNGDGCDAGCFVEPGYTCPYYAPCRVVECGDGLQDSYSAGDGYWDYEQCDDGNTASGDGCSSTCEPEPGFQCLDPGTPCKDVVCGDGAQDWYYVLIEPDPGTGGTGFGGMGGSGPTGPYIGYSYEACDDGNLASGDGCSPTCETETGWVCDYAGQPCRQPRCGDGFIDYIPGAGGTSGSGGAPSGGMGSGDSGAPGGGYGGSYGSYEGCDDGNVTSGDGCSASCTIEPGYSCGYHGIGGAAGAAGATATYTCKLAVCGDGITDYPIETCDDGNTVSGDYCTDTCQYDYGGYGGYGGVGGSEPTSGTGGTIIGGGAGMVSAGGRSGRGG